MTHDEIKKAAPKGATHWDGEDYWKNDNDAWYIWIATADKWFRIHNYRKFHFMFKIQPL